MGRIVIQALNIMSSFKYKSTTHAAVPRNGRLLDGRIYPKSGSSSSWTGNGGSVAQYWQLITQDADGNDLGEENYYLMPVDEVSVASAKDVVAFLTAAPVEGLPVATYDQLGLVKIKQGCGLSIVDGVLSVDEGAIGGGLDEAQLEEYLTTNKYMKEGDGLTLSSKLTGYTIGESYPPLSADDTILSAFGKLEKNFERYVDTFSNQSVDGIKTFAKTIYGNQDVVCYATGTVSASLPVASTTQLGLVKIGANLSIDANGVLSASSQAGGLTDCSPADSTSGYVTSITYYSSSKSLIYQRTTPQSLSWSYGSVTNAGNGSYNSLAKTSFIIPSNTSHLTNGAGFIYDANSKFTSLQNSGNNTQYLAGDGKFYTIGYGELSGVPDLSVYVTLAGNQTITGAKTYSAVGWYNGTSLLKAGPSNNVHIIFGAGSGNCINGVESDDKTLKNLYFNYGSASSNVLVDKTANLFATGDVVAYSTSSAVSTTPIATTSQLGLVRVKSGGGIAIDSNGYLTCTVTGGGGGSSVTVSPIQTSGTKIATITVDGTDKNLYAPSVVSIKSVSQTTANTGAGQANTVSVLNTNNASIGTFTVYNGPQGPYWRPSYNSSTGVLSWSSSTSTSAPSSANIKGSQGVSISSITAKSTSDLSGKPNVYNVNGSNNTVLGTFTVYNGAANFNGGQVNSNIKIKQSSGPGIRFQHTSIGYHIALYLNGSKQFVVAGNSGIDSSSSDIAKISAGASAWTYSSDIRLKNLIGTLDNVLSATDHIDIIKYTWKDGRDNRLHIGVSAQDFSRYFPEITDIDENGYFGVQYGMIGVISLQACKELHSLHKSLDTRVSTIEQWRITTDTNKDALVKRVEALEQMINNKTA